MIWNILDYYETVHKSTNELLFCHVPKKVEFCDMKDKECSPELILQKLKTSEEDALKIKEDFLKTFTYFETLNCL